MEIDHFFIGMPSAAAADVAARQLKHAGFTEGSGRSHPKQGSTNRRYFFHNAMVELLWIHNPDEAQLLHNRALGLIERCRSSGLNRFGVCFRPSVEKPGAVGLHEVASRLQTDVNTVPPSPSFSSTDFHPHYLPESLCIDLATDSVTTPYRSLEPLWFHLSFASAQHTLKDSEPLQHDNGCTTLTGCTLASPQLPLLSSTAQDLRTAGLLSFADTVGDHAVLELEFDHGRGSRCLQFDEVLPLTVRY